MKRVILLALLASSFVMAVERPANACTCIPLNDMKSVLRRSDAAFVGTFVDSAPDRSRKDWPFKNNEFSVQAVYKGAIPSEVVVRSGAHSAACGIAAREGDRLGLFLERDEGVWTSNLCSQVSVADMQRTGVSPSRPIDVEAAGPPPKQGANAIPVEALWALTGALLLLTVALMLARERTVG